MREVLYSFFFFPPSWNHFFKKGLRNRRLFRHRPNVHPHCLQIVSAAAATESCVALVMYCTVPDFSATWVSLRLHICTLCLCVTSEAEGNATEIITAHISAFLWQQPQRVLNHHTAINRVGLFCVVIMLLSRMSKRELTFSQHFENVTSTETLCLCFLFLFSGCPVIFGRVVKWEKTNEQKGGKYRSCSSQQTHLRRIRNINTLFFSHNESSCVVKCHVHI